ncbi:MULTISPECIES: hypothetical protein [Burkholderia]|uniref:hypothetical protein n=1 Tax=Burkholderia TaxID=32008 RepID=UPI00158C6F45|nr:MULTISPECIES: hypothetical protein [Burkholderia]
MINRMTPARWRELRAQYVAGRTAKWLAQRFPISAASIHRRSCKERWRDAALAAEQATLSGE